MTRFSIVVATLAVSMAMFGGIAAAQETNTIADGGHSVADPSNPIVADEGEVETYGDISTGNSGGEVLGDPAGLASIQDHDTIANSIPPPVLVPEDDPAPAPAPASAPVPAPADSTTTTTADTSTASGETAAPDGTTSPAATAAPTTYCGNYATWYDAQVAYETAGGVNADPALVQAADPDYDGVACEELIVY